MTILHILCSIRLYVEINIICLHNLRNNIRNKIEERVIKVISGAISTSTHHPYRNLVCALKHPLMDTFKRGTLPILHED